MSESDGWIEQESKYLFQNYGRQPIVLTRGQGTQVWDADGKEYLDFVGGLAVNSLGHSHPAIVEAVSRQAGQLLHTSNLYYTQPMISLARMLVERSCLDRVFFCNSGAEAVETAIKVARRWGKDVRGGTFEIIATLDGFHGRTAGALAATGTERYREPFEPLPQGFLHVPWDDLDAIKDATTEQTVAVLIEPIQGEGGVNMPSPGFFKGLRKWCDDNELLLMLDEIQTGIGRTGTLFAHEQEGIEPDVMCLAKGLAGGLPIGAVMAREEIAAHLVPGDHGSTFGASPLTTAAAVATLTYIEENNLLERARDASEFLLGKIRQLEDSTSLVTGSRGRGLLLAIELNDDVSADVAVECRNRGLLVNNVRPDAIRLMPPLNVTNDELERACEIFGEACAHVSATTR